MSEALRDLHRECGNCAVTRYVKEHCELTVAGTALGIDCDRCAAFCSNETRPDYLILFSNETSAHAWIVVEMKSQVGNAGAILRQLQAGLTKLDQDRRFQPRGQFRRALAIVLHRGIQAAEAQRIKGAAFRLRGKRVPVVVKRCGYHLPLAAWLS